MVRPHRLGSVSAGVSKSNTQWAKIKNRNKVVGQTRYLLKY